MPTPQQPQMAMSDFNLQKLDTKELSEHVSSTIQMGGNIAVFGRRGTGKTEISKAEIKKLDCKEIYMNLSVMERPDLGGYPDVTAPNRGSNYVNFLLPRFYEEMIDGKQGVVALLDEVDKADPSLWAPLLEFVQFRSINGRVLPNLQAIIMTGNLISEGGARPSLPLLDRTEKFLVEADAKLWLDWAGKSGRIHPSVTAYIHDNKKDLFGAVDPDDRYADPSPRGWDRASQIIFAGEERGWSPYLLNKKVAGCVGKEAGIKYSIYYEHYLEILPMVERIYAGENIYQDYRALPPAKQLVACMIVCTRLANHLDQIQIERLKPDQIQKLLPRSVEHIGRFLHEVTHENVLVAVRSQVQIERLCKFNLDEHPDWADVLNRINKDIGQ